MLSVMLLKLFIVKVEEDFSDYHYTDKSPGN
jgi:hypothetical protein